MAIPQPSLDLSSPEVHIEPKLVQAADMRINTTDLGFTANALIDGAYVSDYYLDGKKIDLTVIGEDRYAQIDARHRRRCRSPRRWASSCRSRPWPTCDSPAAPSRSTTASASGRSRFRSRRPRPCRSKTRWSRFKTRSCSRSIAAGQLEGGYHINLAGTADKLRETWQALRFNILLACVITYLLMAALFESWLYPFVIILTRAARCGRRRARPVLLNCICMHADFYVPQTLDVLTMLGFVILIGTVVNNPILIVHQSLNHMREDGMSPSDAIVESVRTRIRPILMTAVTTVLGLLPLVLFPGAGSELYRGLGAVLLGGLIASTVLPLVLVPRCSA